MASAQGKWETVVSKKKGPVSKSDVRKAKQSFLDNATSLKAEFKNPLEEGETIYEAAFKDKENRNPNDKYPSFHKVDLLKKEENVQPLSSKKSQQKSKKHHKTHKPSQLDGIEDKISKLNHEELSIVISSVQEKFPTHPLIWLKEVASWFQKQFPGKAEKDLMFESKPKGFPYSNVGSEVKKELKQLLGKCSDLSIEKAFCFCLTAMIDELHQGRMTVGLRIVIQWLIDFLPKVLITKMDEALSGKDISQKSYLIVIWTFSQLTNDLSAGLKIWWKVMFPGIKVSSHTPHVVNYIEDLIRRNEKAKFTEASMDTKKFHEILRLVFSSKSQLADSPSLKSRVHELYPTFKAMYFGDKFNAVNTEKFKKLLAMLGTADSDMQPEIFRLLVLCLSKDPQCFAVWLENVEGTLKSSSILWDYMLQNSDDVLKELINGRKYKDRDILRENANKFLVELRHIKRKGNGSKIGFAECYEACNNFQYKTPLKDESGLSLWKLLRYMVIGALAFVFVDIYSTKGYKGSRIEKISINFGVNEHIETSIIHLEGMATYVGRWSKENVPKYYATVSPYVGPAIETTWNYTVNFSTTCYEYAKPGLAVISKQMENLFEMVDKYLPGYASKISENAIQLWDKIFPTFKYYTDTTVDFIATNTPVVTNQISTVLYSTWNWIYQLHPTFFDAALGHTRCALHCTIRYIQDLWQFILYKTPIIMEASVGYLRFVVASVQHYCAEGQLWLQNALRSSTGGGNAASS